MIWVGLLTLLGALPLISATCDQPDIPPNAMLIYKKGIIRGNNFLEDSEVIFVYSTSNGKAYFHSFCQNGNWTEPIPFNVTLCGEPTDSANQTLLEIYSDYVNPVEGTYYEGTRVYFRCELGNGKKIVHHPMVCQANGEWTQTARCEVTCPPLRLGEKGDPRDATYNTSLLTDELHSRKGYSVDTMASFRCVKLGDKFSSVICQSSGKWGQQTSTCDAARCGHPLKLPNQTLKEISLRTGDCVDGKYREGTVAYYYPCELGNGSRILSVCQANGEWTHSRCEEVICPSLTLENADVIYNTDFVLNYASRVLGFVIGYKVNTLVTFSCGYSYYIEGSHSAICQTSGEWSQPVPKCIHTKVICPLLRLEHGEIMYNKPFVITFGKLPWTFVTGYPVNTLASFSCDKDFRREGSSSAICQSSGNWSEQTPICTGTPCLKPTVENGYFTVILEPFPAPNDTVFLVHTFLEFGCNPGYTLSTYTRLIFCQPNGSWDEPIPSCILKKV